MLNLQKTFELRTAEIELGSTLKAIKPRPYEREEFPARTARADDRGPQLAMSPVELRPEPFQERLLEQIALSRRCGHHRNLLVSATGTGKTVMAALDHARLREVLPRARLLFVAHREEILTQTVATFRHALRDHAFGEMWSAGSARAGSSTSSPRPRAFMPPGSNTSTRLTSTS